MIFFSMCLVRYPRGAVCHLLISMANPDHSLRCFCCERVEMLFLSDASCCSRVSGSLSSCSSCLWCCGGLGSSLCCSGLVKTWRGLPLSTCLHLLPSNPVLQPQGPHRPLCPAGIYRTPSNEMSHIREGQKAKMKEKEKKKKQLILLLLLVVEPT